MKKKLFKYIRIFVSIALILSLVAPSYASLSASDGSAFVTKAEFDSALADFNSRLTTFEAGINSKIDSQVTSYLDRNGIWSGAKQTLCDGIDASGTTQISFYDAFGYNTSGILAQQYRPLVLKSNIPTTTQSSFGDGEYTLKYYDDYTNYMTDKDAGKDGIYIGGNQCVLVVDSGTTRTRYTSYRGVQKMKTSPSWSFDDQHQDDGIYTIIPDVSKSGMLFINCDYACGLVNGCDVVNARKVYSDGTITNTSLKNACWTRGGYYPQDINDAYGTHAGYSRSFFYARTRYTCQAQFNWNFFQETGKPLAGGGSLLAVADENKHMRTLNPVPQMLSEGVFETQIGNLPGTYWVPQKPAAASFLCFVQKNKPLYITWDMSLIDWSVQMPEGCIGQGWGFACDFRFKDVSVY